MSDKIKAVNGEFNTFTIDNTVTTYGFPPPLPADVNGVFSGPLSQERFPVSPDEPSKSARALPADEERKTLNEMLMGPCAGGQCWFNPETGYWEYCPEHDSQAADICMAEPKRPQVQGGDYRPHYRQREADAYMAHLERELTTLRARVKEMEDGR